MTLKTTPWDSADYLKTEADRTAYLKACLEEAPHDPAFIAHALGVVARARNMSQLSRDTGLTREGLYKALSEEGNPSFDTVLKVVNALGYRLALVSQKKKDPHLQAGGEKTASLQDGGDQEDFGANPTTRVKPGSERISVPVTKLGDAASDVRLDSTGPHPIPRQEHLHSPSATAFCRALPSGGWPMASCGQKAKPLTRHSSWAAAKAGSEVSRWLSAAARIQQENEVGFASQLLGELCSTAPRFIPC